MPRYQLNIELDGPERLDWVKNIMDTLNGLYVNAAYKFSQADVVQGCIDLAKTNPIQFMESLVNKKVKEGK